MLDPTSSLLASSRSPLTLIIKFDHAQIMGKEAWHNREHVLFSHSCSVSQTGNTDRRTDELPVNDQSGGTIDRALLANWFLISVN